MGKKSRFGSGMNIPDHISESLETIFGLKRLGLFDADLFDHESGMEKFGSGIRDKQPGSATLITRIFAEVANLKTLL
jgi:hypothetical protein